MSQNKLTRAQVRLLREVMAIAESTETDYSNAVNYLQSSRLLFLQRARALLVRGFIVEQYVFIDEMLAIEVAKYFFRGTNFIRMWKRSQKFANFNYFILEKLSVLEKLALVKEVRAIPRAISQRIESIVAIRNVVAHVLFPENLRVARGKVNRRRVLISFPYKGQDVFTPQGLQRFKDDAEQVIDFFTKDHAPDATRLR